MATLPHEPAPVLRISLANKLHNLRTVAVDLVDIGDSFWSRFNAGRDDQAWYYRELVNVFEEKLPQSRHLPEFSRLVAEVF